MNRKEIAHKACEESLLWLNGADYYLLDEICCFASDDFAAFYNRKHRHYWKWEPTVSLQDNRIMAILMWAYCPEEMRP